MLALLHELSWFCVDIFLLATLSSFQLRFILASTQGKQTSIPRAKYDRQRSCVWLTEC